MTDSDDIMDRLDEATDDPPNECPTCGCENIGYSAVKRAFVCDNGCNPWRPDDD